jgi:hypothetical protein
MKRKAIFPRTGPLKRPTGIATWPMKRMGCPVERLSGH